MKPVLYIFLTGICLLLSAIAYAMPNPAAVNCSNQGNRYVMIKNVGLCIFPDQSYCEEWAYFRGRCVPGTNFFPGRSFNQKRMKQYCIARQGGTTTVRWCKMYR